MEKKLETTLHDYDGDDEVDRISELPEHVIHRIMEFLPKHTADVTRISALSRKFFSYWCSFPVLDFDTENILGESKVRDAESVLNSIHYTFRHRRLNINTCLQRLTFFGPVNNSNARVIHEMINFATLKQVKMLDLCVPYDDEQPHSEDQLVKLSCFPEPVFSTKSITILSLRGFNLEARHLTLSSPLIEDFSLLECSGITSIILRGEKLRRVWFMDCYGLEKIQVDGPTGLDVRYSGKSYCDISVASNESVKVLLIEEAHIIDKWFGSNFCRFVENLVFCMCSFPVKTRWYFHRLKRLTLDKCHCKVEFETPNLERFDYCGSQVWDTPLVISSRRFDAKLEVYQLSVDPIFRKFCIARLRDVIRFITQCQTLTLRCGSTESLMYPRAMRKRLNPQLHDMKHLKIQFRRKHEVYITVELIDSLLWLAPRPNTISFIGYKSQAVLKSIKFNYHDATSKNARCCGSICDVKCWPQHLKEVELHKFEDVDERTSLQTYFFSTYRISTVINEEDDSIVYDSL